MTMIDLEYSVVTNKEALFYLNNGKTIKGRYLGHGSDCRAYSVNSPERGVVYFPHGRTGYLCKEAAYRVHREINSPHFPRCEQYAICPNKGTIYWMPKYGAVLSDHHRDLIANLVGVMDFDEIVDVLTIDHEEEKSIIQAFSLLRDFMEKNYRGAFIPDIEERNVGIDEKTKQLVFFDAWC